MADSNYISVYFAPCGFHKGVLFLTHKMKGLVTMENIQIDTGKSNNHYFLFIRFFCFRLEMIFIRDLPNDSFNNVPATTEPANNNQVAQ